MSTSFELQVLRAEEWRIESVFDCKQSALSKARDMEEFSPKLTLRVIEEFFDPDSGRVDSMIIYRSHSAEEDRHRSEEHYLKVARDARKAEPQQLPATRKARPRRKPSFVEALITLVLAIGSIGLVAIYGLLWLSEVMH